MKKNFKLISFKEWHKEQGLGDWIVEKAIMLKVYKLTRDEVADYSARLYKRYRLYIESRGVKGCFL